MAFRPAILLLLLVLVTMVHPGESLISIAQAALRKAGAVVNKKLKSQGDAFQRPELLEASPIPPPKQTLVAFDTDAYRQEMIDLVYQRSMERFS
eukprot:scaffold2018_cov113-Cylindrotheca_fusiformis.AAC.11